MGIRIHTTTGSKDDFHGATVLEFEDHSILVRNKLTGNAVAAYGEGDYTLVERIEDAP